jgi:1-acyl-sn-glycerol-3-phosphate acyltransferase
LTEHEAGRVHLELPDVELVDMRLELQQGNTHIFSRVLQEQMARAVDAGASLIFFPEGTRNLTDEPLLPFKSGLYRLALSRPGIEMVPVWITNLNRAMRKGELIPVPILCTVSFGMPVRLRENEEKTAFLERARAALLSLRPREHSRP